MNPKLKRGLRLAVFPAFYFLALFLFMYWTFPHQRLKDRLVAEFNASQAPQRLQIEELSWYFLTGIEAEGIRLISPPGPKSESGAALSGDTDSDAAKKKPEKPKVLEISEAHVSVSILRLLFGSLSLSFGAEIGGGTVSGAYLKDDEHSELELELENVGVGVLTPLEDAAGLPLEGQLSGTVDLHMPEASLAQADGSLELTISELALGDGKAKVRDLVALPRVQAGDLTIKGEVTSGSLELQEFAAKGPDLEMEAGGRLRLRDPFEASLAEMTLGYKFSERYKNKSDITKGLFSLIELDPKVKRARAADGSYNWRLSGALKTLNFSPGAGRRAVPGAPSRARR